MATASRVGIIVGVWFRAGAMFVFLVLSTLYPKDRLRICRALNHNSYGNSLCMNTEYGNEPYYTENDPDTNLMASGIA